MANQTRAKWRIVIEPPNKSGYVSYPVFKWVYNPGSTFYKGGELFTQVATRELVLRKEGVRVSPGKSNIQRFSSADEAIKIIKESGWEEPLYVAEVFKIILSAKDKLYPSISRPEARKILKEAQDQWEALLRD